MIRSVLTAGVFAVAVPAFAGEAFHVDPGASTSNFSAVFAAKLGERINAVSSRVSCDATYDEKAASLSGTCAVPLTGIMVDHNPTKSGHFQQWATHQKSDPQACALEARFEGVRVEPPLSPRQESKFTAEVPFTVCGRSRDDGGKEKVTGAVALFPASGSGSAATLTVRARVEGFSRDRYRIGPRYAEGWLARVEQLAPLVADVGTIDLFLLARSAGSSIAH